MSYQLALPIVATPSKKNGYTTFGQWFRTAIFFRSKGESAHLDYPSTPRRIGFDLAMTRPAAYRCPLTDPSSEQQMHAELARYLRKALPPNAKMHHSPNEGSRGWIAQAELKQTCFSTGWPDVEIIWQGRAHFIELKFGRNEPTPEQKQCIGDLIQSGANVGVAKSVQAVIGLLVQWGIPLGISWEEWLRLNTTNRLSAEEYRLVTQAPRQTKRYRGKTSWHKRGSV